VEGPLVLPDALPLSLYLLGLVSVHGYKKASRRRGRGKLSAATPRGLPGLEKELLPVHAFVTLASR
jgi:hypothetical protein